MVGQGYIAVTFFFFFPFLPLLSTIVINVFEEKTQSFSYLFFPLLLLKKLQSRRGDPRFLGKKPHNSSNFSLESGTCSRSRTRLDFIWLALHLAVTSN